MEYKYIHSLPYSEILRVAGDEKVKEMWIVFAYFSSDKVTSIFKKLKNRTNEALVHVVFSSSSVNPLQEVVDEILEMDDFRWFEFQLVEQPLMHSKLFAARYDEKIIIYTGSANLTNKATRSNIESGVILNLVDKGETLEYLKKVINTVNKACKGEDSIQRLKSKSVLSHIRSELLFLALEESKTRQAISIRPERIRELLSDATSEDVTESTVTVKSRNTINIFILDKLEWEDLLDKETALKAAIKGNLAIKLDGYGWVSSVWSIGKILGTANTVNDSYNMYIEALKKCRDKYNKHNYRRKLSQKIKTDILGWLGANSSNALSPETENILDKELSRLELSPSDKKSPYKKIENLCQRLIDTDDLVTLLNPYKIGDDELQGVSNVDDIEVLSTDEVNLMVMCQLAIKLRSSPGKGKIPVPPSVWWFDIALDKCAFGLYGYENIQEYKKKTRIRLEEIKSDVRHGASINECVDDFCSATGFNLGAKYPIETKLFMWDDDGEKIEDEPYVFLYDEQKNYARYNIKLPVRSEFNELMLYMDMKKFSKEWELDAKNISLSTIEGEFVLGKNLKIFYEDDNYAYLCATSLLPK